MTTATSSSPIVERLLGGTAPRAARLAAARGALPLSPAELTLVQVEFARQSDDPELAAAASESLSQLEPMQAVALAHDGETPSAVLEFLAHELVRWPDAGRSIAARAGLTTATLRALAESSDLDTLTALALNHVALATQPQVGALLAANPRLPEGAKGRLLDVLEELDKARQRQSSEPLSPTGAPSSAPPPARDPFLAALGIDAEVEALLPTLELGLEIGALAERSELIGGIEDDDDASIFSRLSRLNVGQKLRVALFGSAGERAILVRDSNRLVAASVVKNPKFTEQEAESVSKSRNVNDVVLRLIARHRDFGNSYSIQHNMVKNPRCPVDLALNFLGRLNDRDVALLLKNRNVSDAVRRQAKRTFEVREERRRVRSPGKKH